MRVEPKNNIIFSINFAVIHLVVSLILAPHFLQENSQDAIRFRIPVPLICTRQ